MNDQRKQIILNRLEQIEQDADSAGYKRGWREGHATKVDAAYQNGYKDGVSAGKATQAGLDHNAIHAAYQEGFADAKERALEIIAKALSR